MLIDIHAFADQFLIAFPNINNGVDDKRVDAGSNHPIGMVVAVEGDGGARSVEVLGHRHPHREDLAVLPLALARSELRRWSTVDHAAVVDGREALVFFVLPLLVVLFFPLVVLFSAPGHRSISSACGSLRACDLLLPCDKGRAPLASCRRWPPLGVLEAFCAP